MQVETFFLPKPCTCTSEEQVFINIRVYSTVQWYRINIIWCNPGFIPSLNAISDNDNDNDIGRSDVKLNNEDRGVFKIFSMGGCQHSLGPEYPLKSVDFTGPGGVEPS